MEIVQSAQVGTAPPAAAYPADIRTLTSLRYFAALWVVLFHWSAYFPGTVLSESRLVKQGYLGVDFFFVLSGFILCHVYLRRMLEGRLDYWNFISRRFARIYPMHVLTLCGMVVFGVLARHFHLTFAGPWSPAEFFDLPSGELPREFMGHLMMIHAWGAGDGLHFNAPSWSISAEMFAYLMFPIFVFGLSAARRHPWPVLVATVAFVVIYATVLGVVAHREVFEMSWNIGLLRIIPDFALGVALYWLGLRQSAGPLYARIGVAGTLALAVLLLATGAPTVAVVLTLAAFIWFCADAERWGGLGLIRGNFAVLLGEVSYSVYMLHFPVGILLLGYAFQGWIGAGLPNQIALTSVAVVVVTVLSYLTHRFVEIPARTFLNRKATAVMAGSLAG